VSTIDLNIQKIIEDNIKELDGNGSYREFEDIL
jgi:hypothetical protein